MTTSGITNINAKLIHQHPDNPRKDLGDLTELSESIKKKGIMQNLTVIPGHWDEDKTHHDEGYTLIIGHRRFAAGKMAGVAMYPCRIVEDMSYKDQVGTMLEENMRKAFIASQGSLVVFTDSILKLVLLAIFLLLVLTPMVKAALRKVKGPKANA